MHATYEYCRVGGEWFRLNGGDINSISRIAEAHCPDDLPKRIRLHAHAAYSRSPLPDFAPQTSGFMIRLPESARPILTALKAKNRRPTTTEMLIALERHAKAEGVELPTLP